MMTPDNARRTLGLYLHIPFCLRKCYYCDFCSAHADADTRAAYVNALCRHLEAAAPAARGITVESVYFGGGTPTLLQTVDFMQIMRTVRAHFDLDAHAEVTSECNPVTNAAGLFEGLLEAGVNRLSIGLQSVHENELRLLGRLHTFADFLATYDAARRAGFRNINADVMFGIPAQTLASLANTLNTLCDLSPEHISAYGLRIEEGTPFWERKNSLPLPDEDTEADMADLVASTLEKRGYERYEISNYARNGYYSRHNLRYWLGEDYLGFGPAAHSFFGGVRFAAPPDTAAYISAVQKGDFEALAADRHTVGDKERREEYVMLRMRLAQGVDKNDFKRHFGLSFKEAYGDLSALVSGGFLKNEKDRVAFTARGMQVSNAILSEWLDFGGVS